MNKEAEYKALIKRCDDFHTKAFKTCDFIMENLSSIEYWILSGEITILELTQSVLSNIDLLENFAANRKLRKIDELNISDENRYERTLLILNAIKGYIGKEESLICVENIFKIDECINYVTNKNINLGTNRQFVKRK